MAGGTLNIAEHSGELSRHCMARLETYRACYSMGPNGAPVAKTPDFTSKDWKSIKSS